MTETSVKPKLEEKKGMQGAQLTWKETFNGGENRGAHSNPSRASENISKESVRWVLAN